jgi:hypothetical protein
VSDPLRDPGFLTPDQLKVVHAGDDIVLTACPGSGKTRTAGARVVLRSDEGLRVAATSYTNVGVRQIRQVIGASSVGPSGRPISSGRCTSSCSATCSTPSRIWSWAVAQLHTWSTRTIPVMMSSSPGTAGTEQACRVSGSVRTARSASAAHRRGDGRVSGSPQRARCRRCRSRDRPPRRGGRPSTTPCVLVIAGASGVPRGRPGSRCTVR